MTADELEAAWAALDDAMPAGWYVGRAEGGRWSPTRPASLSQSDKRRAI